MNFSHINFLLDALRSLMGGIYETALFKRLLRKNEPKRFAFILKKTFSRKWPWLKFFFCYRMNFYKALWCPWGKRKFKVDQQQWSVCKYMHMQMCLLFCLQIFSSKILSVDCYFWQVNVFGVAACCYLGILHQNAKPNKLWAILHLNKNLVK